MVCVVADSKANLFCADLYKMVILCFRSVAAGSKAHLSCPYLPLDILKENMMALMSEAVEKGAAHIRDPLGGTNETLFA